MSAIVRLLRFPFIVMVALLPGLFATGQVKFTTIASSQEIGRGEYLQVEFVVENAKQIDQLNPPDFPGFHIAQGPIQSSGMSIVNGNMSQYKAVSFVLQPSKTGKFVIEGATAQVDGKNMRSNPVTITVNTSSAGSANNSGNANNSRNNPFMQPAWPDPSPADVDRDNVLRPGENIKEKIRKNLFLKIQVDKTSCYVGESIVATYKLYSRLSSESRVTKRPSLNGFSVYDMVDPNSDAASVETLNGKAFTVHIIRKTQLIPLQAGTIDLDPVEVENTVHFVKGSKPESRRTGNSLKDLFDQLSDDNAMGPEVEENITLDTKPVSITVKPLPEEAKPVDYNGAVGTFGIQASLANKTIAAGEEAILNLIVKGRGNLPVINAPLVQWPSGMDAFDPTAKEDINKTTVPMSGSKTFSYVFTPGTPGHYTIPSVSFPYFDPATHSYKTVGTEPMDFQVTEAVKKAKTKTPALIQPGDAVASTGEVKKFVQQHLEWIFTILILSGLAGWLWRQNARLRRAEQQQKEKEEAEKKAAEDRLVLQQVERSIGHGYSGSQPVSTAPVIVTDPLQEARLLFEKNDYKGFYREVNRALWKALTRKLDLPASELNKNNIARKLQAKGWDMETTLFLESVLNECEMNLYTPAYDAYNMQQLLKQAESMLDKLV
ncbi:MAG TPA: BatD family protein [Puia sp.]|nr:BatD family protein [Puia sp.]